MHHEGLFEAKKYFGTFKKYFGTFKKLAKALGVMPQRLNNWLNSKSKMPLCYAFKVVEVTHGKVTLNTLMTYLKPEDQKWLMTVERRQALQPFLTIITASANDKRNRPFAPSLPPPQLLETTQHLKPLAEESSKPITSLSNHKETDHDKS